MSASTRVEKIKSKTADAAQRTAKNPVVETAARVGYIARGIVYGLIGLLAADLAFTGNGRVTDQTGALATIGAQPFGKGLLLALALGLVGYALWGFVRAILNPLQRDDDAKGWVERGGFLVSGVTYGALALVAFHFATGFGQASTGKPQDLSAQLLAKPYGPWLVVIFGLFWIGAGVGQLYVAWTADFDKDIKPNLAAQEKKWAERIGRAGYAARGVVFGLIGWFLIQSGIQVNPNAAVGLDGALLKLTQQPYGMPLVGIVALGLLAFGIYSAFCARWIRVWKPT